MKYLADPLKRRLAGEIRAHASVYLFLDYDGTLSPIAPRPGLAAIQRESRRLLEKIIRDPRFSVAIVTGRSLKQIRRVMGLKNVVYAGNHGLELLGPGFCYLHAKVKKFYPVLKEVVSALKPLSKSFPGSRTEDKGATLTYHYRLMDERLTASLQAAIRKRLSPWVHRREIRTVQGKKALEIRPGVNWNKGSAVRWLLLHENPEAYPVYIGDDRTDEAAFAALCDRGATIRVGDETPSLARYFVKDTDEVARFLALLTGAGML